MKIEKIRSTIKDLTDVEPKSFGTDAQADEAAQWLSIAKNTEAEADTLLDPAIKTAYAAHKKLTGEKKSLLERLMTAKDRVRVNVANWIAGGHEVKGCYIQTKYRVTVTNLEEVPDEFLVTTVDQKKLDDWAKTTEGKVAIPGCAIDPINILFARESNG